MKFTHIALALSFALPAASVFAQTNATINQRKESQQDRIAQGVQSGQLTASEAQP